MRFIYFRHHFYTTYELNKKNISMAFSLKWQQMTNMYSSRSFEENRGTRRENKHRHTGSRNGVNNILCTIFPARAPTQ